MLFAVRKGCARMTFVVWGTGGRSVSCVCSMRFITERTTYSHEYLHHFFAARNIRASAALCELALVIPRCGTYQFSRSFLPVAVCL